MLGYDTDSWTWDTEEVCRWIENESSLYARIQGSAPDELLTHITNFMSTQPLLDIERTNVQWRQLALWFGWTTEDAHLDDQGD